jgi:hypothetical protein
MLRRETRINYGKYQELRREANRISKKNKKKERMRRQLDDVNILKDQNERRQIL